MNNDDLGKFLEKSKFKIENYLNKSNFELPEVDNFQEKSIEKIIKRLDLMTKENKIIWCDLSKTNEFFKGIVIGKGLFSSSKVLFEIWETKNKGIIEKNYRISFINGIILTKTIQSCFGIIKNKLFFENFLKTVRIKFFQEMN